jgi:hypothetical protein
MLAGISAAIVVVCLLRAGTGFAACPPGAPLPDRSPGQAHSAQPHSGQPHNGRSRSEQSRDCIDLNLLPQITQQIVAGEHLAVPPKTVPAADSQPAYTGPTVGVSRTVRQAPTVGYRWSID